MTIRVAHFVTHPIQYFVPLYRELSLVKEIELTVLFGSPHGVKPSYDSGLGQVVQFDVPLLDGFNYQFLSNTGDGIPGPNAKSFICKGLEQVINKKRFDVLWIHGWAYRAQAQLADASLRAGVPYVLRGESTLIEAPLYSLRWWRRKLLASSIIRRAAACLYVGKNNKQFYLSMGVPEKRLFPAHYSIDVKQFQSAAASGAKREAVRSKYGVQPGQVVIVTVAKLIRRKRVADIIEALAASSQQAVLWVLGDGELRGSLRELGTKLLGNRVNWFGFTNQSQIPSILNAADLFVLASEEETWGLVVNEAMACGLPALVSDKVGCANDLVAPGVTGDTFPCADVITLARMLDKYASDEDRLSSMGCAARDHVAQGYGVQTTSSQIVNVFQKILQQS